jgi:putative Holliday junction resolvase
MDMTPEERHSVSEALKGKRIGAIDYGLKRVGFAVCDEMHILASPRGFFANNTEQPEKLWSELVVAVERERLGAVVVGVPYRLDGAQTPVIEAIERFVEEAKRRLALPVFTIDESFSSRNAVRTMVSSGVKKKQRAAKGRTDAVAAALILRDFLEEIA